MIFFAVTDLGWNSGNLVTLAAMELTGLSASGERLSR